MSLAPGRTVLRREIPASHPARRLLRRDLARLRHEWVIVYVRARPNAAGSRPRAAPRALCARRLLRFHFSREFGSAYPALRAAERYLYVGDARGAASSTEALMGLCDYGADRTLQESRACGSRRMGLIEVGLGM